MPVLNASEIRKRILAGELVIDPRCDLSGTPIVEPASYDLRAGIALWKDKQSRDLKTLRFNPSDTSQPVVTLQPGQMVFVITHEELNLPRTICGTVYSRNRLQKENILALNAGHVDPGYRGPIIIRLINLGQTEWALALGEAVFTVVFHSLKDAATTGDVRSKEDTLIAAQKTAAQAFSNPLHDLYTDELNKRFAEHDQQLETALRTTLGEEFFRRRDLDLLALRILLGIFAVLLAVFRIPWADIWQWLNGCIRH
jgi:deoxycytidine triphosphate deaminase